MSRIQWLDVAHSCYGIYETCYAKVTAHIACHILRLCEKTHNTFARYIGAESRVRGPQSTSNPTEVKFDLAKNILASNTPMVKIPTLGYPPMSQN